MRKCPVSVNFSVTICRFKIHGRYYNKTHLHSWVFCLYYLTVLTAMKIKILFVLSGPSVPPCRDLHFYWYKIRLSFPPCSVKHLRSSWWGSFCWELPHVVLFHVEISTVITTGCTGGTWSFKGSVTKRKYIQYISLATATYIHLNITWALRVTLLPLKLNMFTCQTADLSCHLQTWKGRHHKWLN